MPEHAHATALARALLTLAVTTMWLWFVQFIVVFTADLPSESAWYLRRYGAWAWLKLGFLVPALAGAIVLIAPPNAGPLRLGLVCCLLLAQHVGHLFWLLRPEAPPEASSLWLDGAAVLLLALVLAGWALLRARPRRPA
jgi:hypothetical protein